MPIKMETKKSLAIEIYRSLKDDILWMRLKPGEMLTEQYLAEIYSTSRTPVREALGRLAADNLVTVLPHKGYMITDISYNDLHALFQYRVFLECSSIDYAAQNGSKEQLDHLESLAGNLKAFHDEKPHFADTYFSNTDFHMYLVKITGNHFVLEAFNKIIEQLQRFMWLSTTEAIIDSSIHEHYELVNLIREKKIIEAQKLMRKHIYDIFDSGMERKLKGLL